MLFRSAERVIGGDPSLGSQGVKVDVLQRAARVLVEPKTLEKAERFIAEARRLYPQVDTRIYNAVVDDAKGNTDAALLALR